MLPFSSRIVRTLEAVSYLVPQIHKTSNGYSTPSLADVVSQITTNSKDRTFVRLVETMQFVLDVMGCSVNPPQDDERPSDRLAGLLPGGEGWKSAVRVRLLHGVARWRVNERWERENRGGTDSVPMSQEDVAAT